MNYNISDIINFQTIEIFKTYGYFAFFISTLAQCFYGYLVFHCSTKQMLSFRILMVGYIFFGFLAELLFVLIKPLRLFPLNIVYPIGILAPMSSKVSGLGTAFMVFNYFPMVDILIVTFAERHFKIREVYSQSFKFQRICIYSVLFVTLVLEFIAFENFGLSAGIDDEKAKEILMKNVQNSEILLNFQPSLFIVEIKYISFEFLFPFISSAVSGIFRGNLCSWLWRENLKYQKSTETGLSKQTKKQLSLMLQTAICQAAITFSVGSSGYIWCLLFFIPNINLPGISMFAAGISLLYPLIDLILIVIVVKPYRKAVINLFSFKYSMKNSVITSFSQRYGKKVSIF